MLNSSLLKNSNAYVAMKPPFYLIAISSPIISVLIKTVLVISFRNPAQSVHISQKGDESSEWILLAHITEKYKR